MPTELAVMAFGVTFLVLLITWAIAYEKMEQLAGIFIFAISFTTGLFLLSMVCTALYLTLHFLLTLL